MRNNLDLALRENEVLKKENNHHKAEAARLDREIRRLNGGIETLNLKYDADIAAMTKQYDDLLDQYTSLETSSKDKIQELTDRNLQLTRRMEEEIVRLNTAMANERASFEKTRQALELLHTEKEKEFATRLSSLEAALTEKEAAVESITAMYDEAQSKIETLQQELDNYKTTTDRIIEENKSLTESNRNIQETGSAGQKAPDENTKKDPSLSIPASSAAPAAGSSAPKTP
jgi:chromosome segregation ATPase